MIRCQFILATLMAVVCLTNAQSLDRFCEGVPDAKFVAHPRSCQHWMFCLHNVVVDTGMCSFDFYFDQTDQGCTYSGASDCNFDNPRDSYLTCASGTPETRHNWLNCDQYTRCVNGVPRILNCPEGLWWDQQSEACQLPEDSDCPQRDPLDLPCAADRTYVTYDEWVGCGGYILCHNGVARVVDCQDGFSFDEASHRCQPSQIASCPMSAASFSRGIKNIIERAEQTDLNNS